MMEEMRIGVVGGGVVGQAVARCYVEHVKEVRVWDILPERRTDDLRRVLECDLIFVALPTPQLGGMGLDVSNLDAFFSGVVRDDKFPELAKGKNWVLRSTVPIGTTRRLRERYGLANLVHSPEFLTARCAATDAQMPARNIIGDTAEPVRYTECAGRLDKLYQQRFPHVPVLWMRSDESEAVKLFQNGVFAATVSLWNELRALADKLGLNWDTVRNGILSGGQISPSHTQVPGPDGQKGWGGNCLPKDLAQLIEHLMEIRTNNELIAGTSLFMAAKLRNQHIDRRENKR